MRMNGLPISLTSCNTQNNGPCGSAWQHNRPSPNSIDVREERRHCGHENQKTGPTYHSLLHASSWDSARELTLVVRTGITGWKTNPTAIQAQNHGCDSSSNSHPIQDQLEHMKGLDLQTPSFRISITQINSRLSWKTTSEGPASILQQNPETLNQNNGSLQ